MKRINGLEELQRWVLNAGEAMGQNMSLAYQKQQVEQVVSLVDKVSDEILNIYPFYAEVLPQIVRRIFITSPMGVYVLNPVAFGELYQDLSRQAAFEQIVLASQLMKVLEIEKL